MANNINWGVLFDLDGVLIDSEKEYTRIWNLINDEFPTGEKDFAQKIKGTTLDNILSKYYPEDSVRRCVEARLYEEEAKMKYDYCPGAAELLKALKEADIPIALFTSSNSLKMEHLYTDRPELRHAFDTIITGEMVAHSKPSPEGYLKAAANLGLKPKQCVVIEDSLQGVKAGEAAGGKVVGVAGTLPAAILAPHADMVVDSLGKLSPNILESLFK